jgi:predicted dehydrogenase
VKPRAAIVGAGLMGTWHAHAVRALGGRIALVVDPDQERAAGLARRDRGASVATAFDAGAIAAAARAAHVCTPLDTHDEVVSALVDAGVHVLVEKPLSETAESTAALVAQAESRGVVLCPVHQFLFQRGVRRVLELLPSLGEIRHLDFTACSAGAAGKDDAAQDELVADILPHPLSLFGTLLARPMAGLEWHVERPRPGELRAAATAGGTSIAAVVSTRGRPTVNALRVIGERGSATVDLFHGFAVVHGGHVSRGRKIAQPFAAAAATLGAASANLAWRARRREPAYPGLRELVRAFHLAAQGFGPPPIPGADAVDVAAARDLLLRR